MKVGLTHRSGWWIFCWNRTSRADMTHILNLKDGLRVNVAALVAIIVLFLYPLSLILNFYGIATTFVNAATLALGV